ncbi:MAG: streptogramin lyase [Deltaproteobacteria bacterium]|nr:streptogramin lyase [Deltaproteobacteria bacterium]
MDPGSEKVSTYPLPKGRGDANLNTAAFDGQGNLWFTGQEGVYGRLDPRYLARIDTASGAATVIRPPTSRQGARRVWSDSKGRLWVSEWNAGQLGMYDPASGKWREWRLPGDSPRAYAVYVDETDRIWVTDFGANAFVRFDPEGETFRSFPLPSRGAYVRQLLGRKGEVWGAESGTDKLVVIRFP